MQSVATRKIVICHAGNDTPQSQFRAFLHSGKCKNHRFNETHCSSIGKREGMGSGARADFSHLVFRFVEATAGRRISCGYLTAACSLQSVYNEEIFFLSHGKYKSPGVTVRVMDIYTFMNSKARELATHWKLAACRGIHNSLCPFTSLQN